MYSLYQGVVVVARQVFFRARHPCSTYLKGHILYEQLMAPSIDNFVDYNLQYPALHRAVRTATSSVTFRMSFPSQCRYFST